MNIALTVVDAEDAYEEHEDYIKYKFISKGTPAKKPKPVLTDSTPTTTILGDNIEQKFKVAKKQAQGDKTPTTVVNKIKESKVISIF